MDWGWLNVAAVVLLGAPFALVGVLMIALGIGDGRSQIAAVGAGLGVLGVVGSWVAAVVVAVAAVDASVLAGLLPWLVLLAGVPVSIGVVFAFGRLEIAVLGRRDGG